MSCIKSNNIELYNNELMNQIKDYQIKGLSYQVVLYLLLNSYNALLCDKSYNSKLKRIFRTKRNILMKMNEEALKSSL